MRAIDADVLGLTDMEIIMCKGDYKEALKMLIDKIDAAPTITPERKRKKGEWLANGDIPTECPFCGEDWDKYVFGEVWYTGDLPKFCPNCGEDMREGEA